MLQVYYYSEAEDCWLEFNAAEIVAELEEGSQIIYHVRLREETR